MLTKLLCALRGHDDLLAYERTETISRVYVQCQSCGRSTTGITVHAPRRVERFRRRLRLMRRIA